MSEFAADVGADRLVGRTRELAALRARLDAARSGAGCLVLCAGEAGIGKTRLAQELSGAVKSLDVVFDGCRVILRFG